jgi:glycerol uptake facilitator-like aquaporin
LTPPPCAGFNPAVGTALDVASLLTPNGPSGGAIFSNVWIYWVAPCLGAVGASLLKMYMNLPSHAEAEGLPSVVPVTEAVGTFFIVLTAALTGDGFAVGAMVLAMVYMGDHVCGADYNPAITLGVALRMAIPLAETWKVAATMAAQFGGAMLAAWVGYQVSGTVTYPAADGVRGLAGAAVFEALWSGLLVYVVCAVMTPTSAGGDGGPVDETGAPLGGAGGGQERKGHSRSFQGLAIGFVIIGGIYCATATGGGSGGVVSGAAAATAAAAVGRRRLVR